MPEIDNLLGSTRRVVEEQEPLNNCRGVTYRVIQVGGGGGGAVDSVNGKTGVVVLDATDVGAIPQYETMPTASADNEGQIVQFTGTTDANYTNGYFYKCTGAGEPVVYSWSQVDVQPAPDPLPSQTGNNGKFLSTNGTTASWETVGGLPDQTGNSDKFLTTDGTDASWSDVKIGKTALGNPYLSNSEGVFISNKAYKSLQGSVLILGGQSASQPTISGNHCVVVGAASYANQDNGVALGYWAGVTGIGSILINASGSSQTNSDANTFKVANANGNFEMMNANGNLPADRLASTTGLADGNYRLRLTMASGVPTLTWVAE